MTAEILFLHSAEVYGISLTSSQPFTMGKDGKNVHNELSFKAKYSLKSN